MRARRIAGLALGLLAACNGRPFLHPSKEPVPTRAELVAFARTDAPRHGYFYKQRFGSECPEGPVFVLALGGNQTRAEVLPDRISATLAPWWEKGGGCPIEVWGLSYPGFGPDEGKTSIRRAVALAEEAYAYVRARAGDQPLVVTGYSFGASLALYLAANSEVPPDALLIDRPVAIPRLILRNYGFWNLWLVAGPYVLTLPRSIWATRQARRIEDTPAVFLLAAHDRLGVPRNAYAVASAYGGPRRIVWSPVGHTDPMPITTSIAIGRELAWLYEAARARAERRAARSVARAEARSSR